MSGIGYTEEEADEMVGTLCKCRCGREFYLSFTKGLICDWCSKNHITCVDDALDAHVNALKRKWSKKNDKSKNREASNGRDR
jgi:hypothetical protein